MALQLDGKIRAGKEVLPYTGHFEFDGTRLDGALKFGTGRDSRKHIEGVYYPMQVHDEIISPAQLLFMIRDSSGKFLPCFYCANQDVLSSLDQDLFGLYSGVRVQIDPKLWNGIDPTNSSECFNLATNLPFLEHLDRMSVTGFSIR